MVRISDVTLKQKSAEVLSFREKMELVRILDRLETDVIELAPIRQAKPDSLFVKTVCASVRGSTVALPAEPEKTKIDEAWAAVKDAAKPRLQITAPVSLVQMEYLYHQKPESMKESVISAVNYAKNLTEDVEFVAADATRADSNFLYDILTAALHAGASTVTVCDSAGNALPQEAADFIREIKEHVPSLMNANLGIVCSDDIAMADACSIAAMIAGATEIKTSVCPENTASLKNIATVLRKKGAEYHITSSVRTVELNRLCDQAERMFTADRSKTTPFETGVREMSDRTYTVNDDIGAIIAETKALGYDLSEEDQVLVYDEFVRIASKKEQVTSREVDAIVASTALQVPPVYTIENFNINSSNVFAASAHIRLRRNGELVESVALGDGPVDAAFLALEQIAGRHYELDDFQIRSVTEGREAMGETLVKLRALGKVYSGRGLSTDIIGSSISAYINALNKIVYEEANG